MWKNNKYILVCGAIVPGSNSDLALMILEISYLLLTSRDLTEENLKGLVEWIQFCIIILPLCSYQTIYKKVRMKIRSESGDMDENSIVPWLGETFGRYRLLALEWCLQNDVIEMLLVETSVDALGVFKANLHRKINIKPNIKRYWQSICDGWFHFNGRSRASRNVKQAKITTTKNF